MSLINCQNIQAMKNSNPVSAVHFVTNYQQKILTHQFFCMRSTSSTIPKSLPYSVLSMIYCTFFTFQADINNLLQCIVKKVTLIQPAMHNEI